MLHPPQAEVIEHQLLSSGFHCILQMATGSGKTWLAEQAIAEVLAQGRRAIYLAPLRALAQELSARWQQRFAPEPVGIFTGDYGRTGDYPVPFEQARLLVMTPERLDLCTRAWRSHWHWLPEVDLVVVDELHLLGEGHRGARLEGALSRFRRLNPFARLLGLSATLGNREVLADWMQGVEYLSDWRPVPLDWRILRFRKADQKPGLLVEAVSGCVREGGKSLVFVQSRRRAEQLDQHLRHHGLRALHHHAGLERERRRQVESDFRGHRLDVLVATSSLEMGLNLPVRQVVLYDLQQFDGTGFSPLSVNTVWQRVGRAGRPGLDDRGEAVLLAPHWDHQAKQYIRGSFEAIQSRLVDERALAEQIVIEVGSRFARTEPQLLANLSHSLACFQGRLTDARVRHSLQAMRSAGMLMEVQEERGLSLKVTPAGRVAVRHLLLPETVQRFRCVCHDHPDATFFDLLVLVTCSADCEPVLPVDFEALPELAEQLARQPSRLLVQGEGLTNVLGVGGRRLLAGLKMALLVRGLTQSTSTEALASRNDCYTFEIERLADAVHRLLTALNDLLGCETVDSPTGPDAETVTLKERVVVLTRMVTGRLDESAVTLTTLPGLGPVLARRLVSHGIRDIEDLAQTEPAAVATVPGIARRRAAAWVAMAEERLPMCSPYRYREESTSTTIAQRNWPAGVDPYRLHRALELKVRAIACGYRVTGGLDPHRVRRSGQAWHCDCADFGKSPRACKHILAVRLHQGDRALRGVVKRFRQDRTGTGLDVFDLWYAQQSTMVKEVTR